MDLDPSKFKKLIEDKQSINDLSNDDLNQVILYMYHTYCTYSKKEMYKVGHIGMKALFDMCINEQNRRGSEEAYKETSKIAKYSFGISIIALLATVGGLLVDFIGDKNRQEEQICALESILETLQKE